MALFLEEDGEPSREDDGDTDTNRGDLMPLETCGFGVGLGGGLKGQDSFVTAKSSVEHTLCDRVAKVLTIREAADGYALQQGVEREPTEGGRVAAEDDSPCR